MRLLKTASTKKTIECLLCRNEFEIGEGREVMYAMQSLLCIDCRIVLKERWNVPFAKLNGGYTKLAAYLNLVKAVRLQAETDKKLDDFESYWIESPKWHALWDLVKSDVDKYADLHAVVRQFNV